MVVNLTSPQEFFHAKVTSVMENNRLRLSQDIEFYLVNLLCAYIEPEKLNLADGDYDPLHTPLAILFKKATEVPPEESLKILKSVGDTSLYVSGFFQDYFNRKTFSMDYFITLGINAYANVSSITRQVHRDSHSSTLYEGLADHFSEIVEVLAYVSDELCIPKDRDILALYERWLQHKSDRLFNKLKEHGIVPIDFKNK